MAADNLLAPSTPEAGTIVPEGQEQKGPLARIGTGVRMATFALALGVGNAQAQQPTEPVQGPILLAQANIEDGRRGPYIAFIPQVNSEGKVVEIKFYRDKNGLIIPLPIENGKLVDGSDAPSDPLRAKIAQRKIIAKYDPMVLVKAERIDLAMRANEEIGKIRELMEQSKLDKNGLYKGFFAIYTVQYVLGNNATADNVDGIKIIINTYEKYGKTILKLNQSEIDQIKRKAEQNVQEKLNTLSPSAA